MTIPKIAPYAIPTELPEPAVAWRLEKDRAALLIHDMQEYFIRAYDLDEEPMSTAMRNIKRLLSEAVELGIPVFYSVQPSDQAHSRRGLLTDMWGDGIQTEEDAAVVTELAPPEQAELVTKWRYSAFNRTDLAESLSFARRDQLIITGVYGHMGCKITAADAFMNDIQPFIINDALADFTQADHNDAVQWVGRRSGVALNTDTALQQLSSPARAGQGA